jgi:hypothetical protein
MKYQCYGRKMNEVINLFYSILRNTKLLIFLKRCKVAVVQGISIGELPLDRGFDPTVCSHFTFYHAVYRG